MAPREYPVDEGDVVTGPERSDCTCDGSTNGDSTPSVRRRRHGTTMTRPSITTTTIGNSEGPAKKAGGKEEGSRLQVDNDTLTVRRPTWSANVAFYPPSADYWRIGRKWYDLSTFDHPGGRQILELARDRFEDCTFVVESSHLNYEKVRKTLRQYQLPADRQVEVTNRSQERHPSTRLEDTTPKGYPKKQPDTQLPLLLENDAFYSVLRRRVARYLASVGCRDGGPTSQCISLYFSILALWTVLMVALYQTGSLYLVVPTAVVSAILGSFGHNWVHQPNYKRRGWALISLDLVGFSSEAWYRDHVLQHHMYTNTPWDNHYHGTDPFLKTDPTEHRNWLQQHVSPNIFHIILCFATYGNYISHTIFLLQGQEVWSIGKAFFVIEHVVFYYKWGWYGLALMFAVQSVMANYYFTIALMNHNAHHCLDVQARNAARDWGHAQLISSADWSVHLTFLQSMVFLWLNFHTVHHLFPTVDYSHHPAIHKIVQETCQEFDIDYVCNLSPVAIYCQMIHSFGTPLSLMQEVFVYGGGI